jgi:ABC-type transport system involved in cytochrome c biogenesis ATPase subunit
LRIRKITVDNFKSLVGFTLDLPKFTCLIGLNGAGKSTVLQFIDFLSQQVSGSISGWLKERNWLPKELNSRLVTKKTVVFAISLADDTGETIEVWEAVFNPTQLHCISETIKLAGMKLEVSSGGLQHPAHSGNQEADQDCNCLQLRRLDSVSTSGGGPSQTTH